MRKDTEDKNSQIKAGLEYLLRSNYVIDQIHDAVIATDLTGKIISWMGSIGGKRVYPASHSVL